MGTPTELRSQSTLPRWLLPSWPTLLLADLSTLWSMLATPTPLPTLTLSEFPELSLLTPTELSSPLTPLRSTLPRSLMPPPEVLSTQSATTDFPTPTPVLLLTPTVPWC